MESRGSYHKEAQKVFGAPVANGVFSELVKRFGPLLADLIFEWIFRKQQSGALSSPTPEGGAAPTVINAWIANILEDNREEILDLIRSNAGILLDQGIAALRA